MALNLRSRVYIVILALLILLTVLLEFIDRRNWVDGIKNESEQRFDAVATALQSRIDRLAPLGESLAEQMSVNPDMTDEQFRQLARPIANANPLVRNIMVSRGLVATRVEPMAGNEAVLGMDFSLRPDMMDGARRAIDTRRSVLAGPVTLIQTGHLGVVLRTPYYALSSQMAAAEELLGLVSLALDLDSLLVDLLAPPPPVVSRVGAPALSDIAVHMLKPTWSIAFAVRGKEGRGLYGDVFWGDTQTFHHSEWQRVIQLPGGEWVLAASLDSVPYPPLRIWLLRGIAALLFALLVMQILPRYQSGGVLVGGSLKMSSFLSLSMLALLLPAVAIQGWMSYRSGIETAEQFQSQLTSEISSSVFRDVTQFFDIPRRVVAFNASSTKEGILDISQHESMLAYFLLQQRQEPMLTLLSVGTDEGEYFSASRPPLGTDRGLRVIQARLQEDRVMHLYRVNDANRRGSLISLGNSYFDARTRPWYQAAIEANGLVWYPAYRYRINDTQGAYASMGMGMSSPLRNAAGEFLGVVMADVSLDQLSKLLEEITRRTGGVAFLAEANGDLLAISNAEPVFRLEGDQGIRLKAHHSSDPQVRLLGETLRQQNLPDGRTFAESGDDRYLIDWRNFSLPDGPALTIAISLPQSQFVAPYGHLLKSVVINTLLVLLVSVIAGLLLSNRIARPLIGLSNWATRLGRGDWRNRQPVSSPICEVDTLSLALENMAQRMEQHTMDLEQQVAQRTAELENVNRELQQLSATDGLTGLANRRLFDSTLVREWLRARREGHPLTLLMLDIDWFKSYNDHYGHLGGDDCLRQVAAVMEDKVKRASDLAARYGGEEFAVIAMNIDVSDGEALAESIRLGLKQRAVPHAGSPLGVVTVSIGVAALRPNDHNAPEDIIALADKALYEAKNRGRNCVVVSR